MKIAYLKSIQVCQNSEVLLLMVGHKRWNFGIQVHKWGIRFMLIWWHVFIHFKSDP